MDGYLFKKKTKGQIVEGIIYNQDLKELLDISSVVVFKDVDGNYSYLDKNI